MSFETGMRELLIVALILLLAAGLVSLFWGRRILQYFHWAVGASILALLVILGFVWSRLGDDPGLGLWTVGWIFPKDERGAVAVGILLDSSGIGIAALAGVSIFLLLLGSKLWAKEARAERVVSALALATAGITLSWIAATPWFGFLGILTTVFAGFISLGTRWSEDEVSDTSVRFIWERSWGVLLAILGTSILAGGRAGLSWVPAEGWGGFSGTPDVLGGGFLLLGLFSLLQAFPFMGWNIMPLGAPPVIRVAFNQVFLSWATFALLVRSEPLFRQLGLFPSFGWVGLVSSFLSLTSSLFQVQGRIGLNLWISAGNALAFSALAFSGAGAAMGIALGVGLAGLGFSNAVASIDVNGEKGEVAKKKQGWLNGACYGSIVVATGLLGLFLGDGWSRWLFFGWDNPGMIAAIVGTYFIFAMQGWRLAWLVSRLSVVSGANWYSVISSSLFLVIIFGWLWLTKAELVFPSGGPTDAVAAVPWVLLGVNFIGFSISYWTSGRKVDLWKKAFAAAPRMSSFIAGAYRLDRAVAKLIVGLRWVGLAFQKAVEEKIWEQWIPEFSHRALTALGNGFAVLDRGVVTGLNSGVHKLFIIPSKFLQLIQSGDVQWYLVLGIGSGIAILLHYLRYGS